MRICILSIVNIKHMSLISLYTSYLEKHGIDYDIIYIDKYGEEEITNAKNKYRYRLKINRDWNKAKKLIAYLGFKKYAQTIMKDNNYDFIIVWRTETALMFVDFLSKKMIGKYCINVRDYCFEKNLIIKNIVKKVVKNSKFTTISSDGFKRFLPNQDYISIHSYNEKLLTDSMSQQKLRKRGDPIHICFIGYVRFFEIDKKLIDALGNDKRYVIQFFGEGSQYLKEYALKKEINNVEFHGGFQVEETMEFLKRADVINNLYGKNDIALDTAISTKFYYAIRLKMPILVFKGTYMEEVSERCGIGFSVDDDFSTLADDFYNWYHCQDFDNMSVLCEAFMEEIKIVNSKFDNKLNEIFIK